MNILKKGLLPKVIGFFLSILYVFYIVPEADSMDFKRCSMLGVQSVFQEKYMIPQGQDIQEFFLKKSDFLYEVLSIGEYLLGAAGKGKKGLSLRYLEAVIKAELKTLFSEIDISDVSMNRGIVSVPCCLNDRKYCIRIAVRNDTRLEDIPGSPLDISQRYVVTIDDKVFNGKAENFSYDEIDAATILVLDEETPAAYLKGITEKRYREIEDSFSPDGTPVFALKYLESGRKVKKERIILPEIQELGINQGLELDITSAPWRETYKKRVQKETVKKEQYSVNETHRPTKLNKPCIFCHLPQEEILFNVEINGNVYAIAVNINPFGDKHILFISREACGQDLAGRTRDIAIFLRTLGTEYEAVFNAPGAAASILHFHAQITKGRAPLRDNIEKCIVAKGDETVEKGVKQVKLSGWLNETKEFISADETFLSEAIDLEIENFKQKNIPYNVLLFADKRGTYTAYIISGGNECPDEMRVVDSTGTVKLGGREVTGEIVAPNPEIAVKMKENPGYLAKAIFFGSTRNILNVKETGEKQYPDLNWKESLRNMNVKQGLMKNIGLLFDFLSVYGDFFIGFILEELTIHTDKTTLEMEKNIEEVLTVVEGLSECDREIHFLGSVMKRSEDIRNRFHDLESEAIVSSLVILARRAERMGRNLIIGYETDWIPGYEQGEVQHNVMNSVINEVDSIGGVLRDMGLENVVIIHRKKNELAKALLAEAGDGDFSNMIILAGQETIMSDDFECFASTEQEKKAFLAVVNTIDLEPFYERKGEMNGKYVNIEIIEMILVALELAVGKRIFEHPLVSTYDEVHRMVIFIPRAVLLEYEKLKELYVIKRLALQAV
ncbi:MAG: hypothetical protein ABH869_04615 [Candidatus Omnitrophota bacterium]